MMPKRSATNSKRDLPFVFINVAMTADGKIAPSNRQFVPFTTKRDEALMMELRSTADAVMSGARTVDLAEVTMGTGGEKYRKKRRQRGLEPEHLRIIVSGSGTIDPQAHIFTQRFSPIIILTTEGAGKRLATLKKVADAVHVSKGKSLDFPEALRWLKKEWGVQRLLCEGGGAINAGLIEAGLVDEIYVTIAPLILGGRMAPTAVDGKGILKLADATAIECQSMRRVGDEMFTVWRTVNRPSRP